MPEAPGLGREAGREGWREDTFRKGSRAGQGSHRRLTSVSQEAGSARATSRMLLAASSS